MDEIVKEKLLAMGYKEVPAKLAEMLNAWKHKQDSVRPGPLSLDAIIMCVTIYEMKTAKRQRQNPPDLNNPPDQPEEEG